MPKPLREPLHTIPVAPWVVAKPCILPNICHKRASVTISENTSIPQALAALGLRLNFYVDPNALISYSAHNKKIIDILADLASLYHWKINIRHDTVTISKDSPYIYLHHINLLNNSVKSSISTGVNSHDQINLGSSASVQTDSSYDILSEIQSHLDFLIKQEVESGDLGGQEQTMSYSINKRAGIIALKAPQSVHLQLGKYLHKLEGKINAQVKIEAKILQVELKDEFSMGINWNSVATSAGSLAFNTAVSPLATFSLPDSSIGGVLTAMQEYGKTHIISKPELTILHNELGMFKVVQNKVYFKLKAYQVGTTSKDASNMTLVRTAEPHVIPVGFSMTIQPSIDERSGDVVLHIRPTLTSVVDTVNDPSVNLDNRNKHQIKSEYPITSAKEFDTKLRLRPGQWVVLGGYIDKTTNLQSTGFPGSNYVPLLGNRKNLNKSSEIVCLIRAFPQNVSNHSWQHKLHSIYSE